MSHYSLLISTLLLSFVLLAEVSAAQTPSPRIINGTPAPEGTYPWMASLEFADRIGQRDGHFCGGALIHPEYVITAAHCIIAEVSAMWYEVRIAQAKGIKVALNRRDLLSSQGIVANVAQIYVHPQYYAWTSQYDVALLRLASPVELPTLQLPSFAEATWEPGTMARILGWGMIDPYYYVVPTLLQTAEVPMVADRTCENIYGISFDSQSMLCAGILSSNEETTDGVDTCYGDSGGPLIITGGDHSVKLAGLTSWGMSCASNRFYGVYTRFAAVSPWVEEVINPTPRSAAIMRGMWQLIEDATKKLPTPPSWAFDYDLLMYEIAVFKKGEARRRLLVQLAELKYLLTNHRREIRASYPRFTTKRVHRLSRLVRYVLRRPEQVKYYKRKIRALLATIIKSNT